MGHPQKMNPKQKLEFKTFQYKRMLEEKRGHNYEYWNDEKHGKMLQNGWKLYEVTPGESHRQWSNIFKHYSTTLENKMKEVVKILRQSGHFARIVCGYDKDVQRTKYYSVIYKKK
jgi:hypothetical protein